MRQSFKQQIEIIYKQENTICTTVGKKISLIGSCEWQGCLSPFRVGKILIYAMSNADYHKIDLQTR